MGRATGRNEVKMRIQERRVKNKKIVAKRCVSPAKAKANKRQAKGRQLWLRVPFFRRERRGAGGSLGLIGRFRGRKQGRALPKQTSPGD